MNDFQKLLQLNNQITFCKIKKDEFKKVYFEILLMKELEHQYFQKIFRNYRVKNEQKES